jgi:hypothetical protein
MGQRGGAVLEVPGEHLLHGLGDAQVEALPAQRGEA